MTFSFFLCFYHFVKLTSEHHGNVKSQRKHTHFDWHLLASNPINFLILGVLKRGHSRFVLQPESLYQQHFAQINFHFDSFEQPLGFWFSGWKPRVSTDRNSPHCCWRGDLLRCRYVFSSYTVPIRHSTPPRPTPSTAAAVKTQLRIKCHSRWHWKEVFKLSTAVTSETSVRGVSLGQMTRNT